MIALTLAGVELTPDVAAELLALAPGEPIDMTDDDALSAISQVLAARHSDPVECRDELVQRYIEDPGHTSARMSRCVIVAARLLKVEV